MHTAVLPVAEGRVKPATIVFAKRDDSSEKTENGSSRGVPLNVVIVVVVALIAVFAGVLMGGRFGSGTKGGVAEKEEEKPLLYFKIPEMTVNLMDNSYVQVELTLSTQEQEVRDELRQRLPEVTDKIFTILQGKSSNISEPENSKKLRGELRSTINGILKEGDVKEVLITGMLVQ